MNPAYILNRTYTSSKSQRFCQTAYAAFKCICNICDHIHIPALQGTAATPMVSKSLSEHIAGGFTVPVTKGSSLKKSP